MNKNDVKSETLRLYLSLPQNKEERMKCIDVRDKIIELNYTFFGYVATHTYINNTSVTYEDKFQSALLHFCEIWWWYQWDGDETHKAYRKDLSFTVFFKPRIGEMIERELNEVKYSIRRSLCMEAGEQLGKHWAQVKYDDLKDVNLSADKMNSLKAIFGAVFWADLDDHSPYLQSRDTEFSVVDMSDNYNSIEQFLMKELIELERPLTDDDLKEFSDTYYIDYQELKDKLPIAMQMLYQKLRDCVDLQNLD